MTNATAPETGNTAGAGASPNLVVNGGFERRNYADDTLPDGWSRDQSTRETALLVAHDAGLALHIRNLPDGGAWQNVFQNLTGIHVSRRYAVSFDGWTNGVYAGRVRIVVFNPTTQEEQRLGGLPFAANSWQRYQFTFETPPTLNGDVRVYITPDQYENPAAAVEIDNLAIVPE